VKFSAAFSIIRIQSLNVNKNFAECSGLYRQQPSCSTPLNRSDAKMLFMVLTVVQSSEASVVSGTSPRTTPQTIWTPVQIEAVRWAMVGSAYAYSDRHRDAGR